MKHFSFPIFAVLFFFVSAPGSAQNNSATSGSEALSTEQVLIVVTSGWDSLQGKLYAYDRIGSQWILRFTHEVVVGSKGMATGDGSVSLPFKNAPVKKEGDKKSPAGIFTIGAAFGYAESKKARWIKDHYVRADDTLICVDDPVSVHYNSLIRNDSAPKDWNSFEQMHRKDQYYKWGLFVNHNAGTPVAGDGSCIFMHIWQNDHEGTDGCTAMKEDDLLKILHWINEKRHPMLVQMPLTEYKKLSVAYRLPSLAGK
jgi:L,D-peptidoglycan transpeptidase YkuD (ErfK/YbiS/YcfS/YnhG family)